MQQFSLLPYITGKLKNVRKPLLHKKWIWEQTAVIEIDPSDIVEAADCLKNDRNVLLDHLHSLTAVDRKRSIELYYYVFSLQFGHKLVILVNCSLNRCAVPSVMSYWPAADWQEREIFDLFGVVFTGRDTPGRILLPDTWAGHPLRKDYVCSDGKIPGHV